MHPHEAIAQQLVASGLSIVPIAPDGSKSPTVKWHVYETRRPTVEEVRRWFAPGRVGVGIIGGTISGNLEILDFDDGEAFEPWHNLVSALVPVLCEILPTVKTPSGGYHVYYRAPAVESNQKLARHWRDGKPGKVRIETRGEGGYVLSPYCPPSCHPLNRCYELLHGSLTEIPFMSIEARTMCLNAARAFDEFVEPPKRLWTQGLRRIDGDRPGDRFAARTSWHDILEPFGWTVVTQHGDTINWKRPGKDEKGISATTGYNGHDILYVFSTNAPPFEERRGYSKFRVFALLRCQGDFTRAAKLVAGMPR